MGRWNGFSLFAAMLLASSLLTAADVQPSGADDVRSWLQRETGSLVSLYRHLHQHPELSLQEKETAQRLAEELRALGVEVTTGVGGHGVVGIVKNGPGPTVLIRTDLDALPIVENTGLVYASQVKVRTPAGSEVGVMHACGHDMHMTCFIGAARYLVAHKPAWQGTLVLIGQPAEERGLGARAMLEDGLYERFPKPDFALALHVDAALEAGRVGCRPGYCLANTDSVDITVWGKGGHGAYPHTTIDPVVQSAQLILALQTIVSREIQPTEPSVITVGSIQGGTKHNIIPDRCQLQLTVRSYSPEVRSQLHEAIRRKAKAIAMASGAPEPEIHITEGTPAVYNDNELAARVEKAFRRALGDNSVTQAELSMGGEDFSHFSRGGVPILMFRLGTVEARRLARYRELGQEPPSLHSPLYYPDVEPTLHTGIIALTSAVLDLMQ